MVVLEVLRVLHGGSTPTRDLGFSRGVRDSADTFSRILLSYDLLLGIKLEDGHRSIFAFFLLLSVLLSWQSQSNLIPFPSLALQTTALLTQSWVKDAHSRFIFRIHEWSLRFLDAAARTVPVVELPIISLFSGSMISPSPLRGRSLSVCCLRIQSHGTPSILAPLHVRRVLLSFSTIPDVLTFLLRSGLNLRCLCLFGLARYMPKDIHV